MHGRDLSGLVGFGRAFRAWIGTPSMHFCALQPTTEDKQYAINA